MATLTEFQNDIKEVNKFPVNPIDGGYYKFNSPVVNKYNHTLHKYPAKFIPQFPLWALEYAQCNDKSIVLDPFCGSGTTLVEAGLQGCKSIGFDISPLAILISKAKTSTINLTEEEIFVFIQDVIKIAGRKRNQLEVGFSKQLGLEYLGMHRTWSNWFRAKELSGLISLRDAILEVAPNEEVKNFALVCLSSITKSCSYLSEDQIKVRYVNEKTLKDPFDIFPAFFKDQIRVQIKLSEQYNAKQASFYIEEATASDLPVVPELADLIVTSPPYINAVDYTMAHKYNLFVLNLIAPMEFWEHSHKYIGVTERAVKSVHLREQPIVKNSYIGDEVSALWNLGTQTAKNRSFVVAQYFNGMYSAFQEMHKNLKGSGKLVFVVGETNNICGRTINTSDILKKIAIDIGFSVDLSFFHVISNRSSLRMNRGTAGGEIKNEVVIVFNKKN